MATDKTSILLSDDAIEGYLVEKDKIILDSKISGDVKADEVITHSKSNITGNIKSKNAVYKGHILRDYHLFFKENFEKYQKKIIKLKKDIPELNKDIDHSCLDYLIILKQINF